MAFTAIAAIGSLLAGGAAVANAAGARSRGPDQSALAGRQLQDTEDNITYQKILNALATRRSVAGYQDSYGSSLQYDPYTNSWTSTLGKMPQEADTSALINTILRNTTDASQQRFANARAAQRAAEAEPGADRAVRDLASYQPVSANALTGLLATDAANANTNAYRPILEDTLRSFTRTGTAAAPVIASVGKQSAETLRDSIVKARISGMQGADALNRERLGTLGNTATTASTLASPQFQSTPFQTSNRGDVLANMQSAQERTAAFAPIYGGSNVNAALGQSGAATKDAISNVPDPNFGLKQLGELGGTIKELTSKDSSLMNGLRSLFGGSSDSSPTARSSALTGWTDPMFNAWNWSTAGT